MNSREKREIVLANKIPLSKIIRCPDKKGLIRCPFPENHSNMDNHKSAFYYKDTNSIHCFTFHRTWTPVLLIAEKLSCTKLKAASLLLKKFGTPAIYSKPKPEFNFEGLKRRKWVDLKTVFSEPSFSGIVSFIEEMADSAIEDDLDIFTVVESDSYRIRDLIMEGEKCQNKQKIK